MESSINNKNAIKTQNQATEAYITEDIYKQLNKSINNANELQYKIKTSLTSHLDSNNSKENIIHLELFNNINNINNNKNDLKIHIDSRVNNCKEDKENYKKIQKEEMIKFAFYWEACKNALNKSNNNNSNSNSSNISKPKWCPYDIEDQAILSSAYESYSSTGENYYVNDLILAMDWFVDLKNKLQINKYNHNKVRNILILKNNCNKPIAAVKNFGKEIKNTIDNNNNNNNCNSPGYLDKDMQIIRKNRFNSKHLFEIKKNKENFKDANMNSFTSNIDEGRNLAEFEHKNFFKNYYCNYEKVFRDTVHLFEYNPCCIYKEYFFCFLEFNSHMVLKIEENISEIFGFHFSVEFKGIEFEELKLLIQDEISNLASLQGLFPCEDDNKENNQNFNNFSNSIRLYRQLINDTSNPDEFFRSVVRAYTYEGFLSYYLNRLLKTKSKKLNLIKHFYISLIASIDYFAPTHNLKIFEYSNLIFESHHQHENEQDNKIDLQALKPQFEHIHPCEAAEEASSCSSSDIEHFEFISAYFCLKVSDYEIKKLTSNDINNNKTLIFPEFLCTTINKKSAIENFLEKPTKEDVFYSVLVEIKIPKYILENEPKNYLFLNNLSEYPTETELLIKSGAVIYTEDVIPFWEYETSDNRHKISYENVFFQKCILRSFSFESYLENLKDNFNFLQLNTFRIVNINLNIFYYDIEILKTFLFELNNSSCTIDSKIPNRASDTESITATNMDNMRFIEALDKNPTNAKINKIRNCITELDFVLNQIGESEVAMEILKEIVNCKRNKIKKLKLSYNLIGKDYEAMKTFKELLAYNKTIIELNLQSNFLGTSKWAMNLLEEGLASNQTVQILDLGNNSLLQSMECIKIFQRIFINNKSIIKLNLQFSCQNISINNFTLHHQEFFKGIKEILISNTTLENINLANNKLGENIDSLVSLKEGILSNKFLKIIDLSINDFKSVETLREIKEIIKQKNSCLEKLILKNNCNETNFDFLTIIINQADDTALAMLA